ARPARDACGEGLSRYARERLLYRLSTSDYRERFVLKGALLCSYWAGAPHRPTRDLDLLGRGEPDVALLDDGFRDLCRVEAEPDGLTFLEESVRGEKIKEEEEYEGVRLRLTATLGNARIPLQVDVGFGDAVVPPPEEVTFPTLLGMPAPRLRAYRRETVVAEKFEAMVKLGMLNSRMKDFYDVWELSWRFDFEGGVLSAAIRATFERRGTPVPAETPLALTPTFCDDAQKRAQWDGFLRKSRIDAAGKTLGEVAESVRDFVMPPALAARQ